MNTRKIITLDGPAGVGKSTLAKQTAAELGVSYLDTGAMFRSLALALKPALPLIQQKPFESSSAAHLESLLHGCRFALHGSGDDTALIFNGTVVGPEIRNEEAAKLAAIIGAVPQVRVFLKKAQQEMGHTCSLVAEGRDMGTEVFPDACCKIFLDASIAVRAKRRYDQLQEMGQHPHLETLTQQMAKRDHMDRTRAIAPLCPAQDATVIDTSELTLAQVSEAILAAAREKCFFS